jgi:hypothetical protein
MANGNEIRTLVDNFVGKLAAAIEEQMAARVQATVLTALGTPARRGPGRPPKGLALATAGLVRARPKQLCPVPGCKNPAAPVFGMVCAAHKDVSKAKIKQYREERRKALKGAAKAAGGTKRAAARSTPKASRARKLQGVYLGALRSLSGEDRTRVKKVAQEQGVAAAVKLATSLKK